MNDRFTDRLKNVLLLASQEAQGFEHECIEPEHLFLGLLKDHKKNGESMATDILGTICGDMSEFRREIESKIQRGPEMIIMGRLPQTERAREVLRLAQRESQKANLTFIDTEHLLLGLLLAEGTIPSQILKLFGFTYELIIEIIQRRRSPK